MDRAGDVCCCIIPPYLLERRARNAESGASERLKVTLSAMRHIHTVRSAAAASLRLQPLTPGTNTKKKRRVFSCENTTDLTAKLVLAEGGSSSRDKAADAAYEWAGVVWDFYRTLFGRNSIDDRGMTVVSSVHYSETGAGFDNALWFKGHMVYGDGGEEFEPLTRFLDVAAHEMTHGVTEYAAGLPYEMESGALNEHFSDVFGVTARQWHEKDGDPAKANWLVGAGILKDGGALRSMSAPGSANPYDPQPGHMRDFVKLPNDEENDWGGVHYNSGIPNRAFYLAAVAIGGPAWETAAQIWYKTLTERLKGATTFKKCAYETVSVARDFFDDQIAAKVAQAWIDVGVIKRGSGPLSSLLLPARPTAAARSTRRKPETKAKSKGIRVKSDGKTG